MRPKLRFEIFKRDDFTCQYCGRKTPDVILEVDHVIPRAEGGTDEPENLVTACWDCNRGKGASLLADVLPEDIEERTKLLKERERQLRAYNEVRKLERERKNAEFDEVWTYWFDVWGVENLPRYYTPWESSLKSYVEKLGVAEVQDAMDITVARFRHVTTNAVKYFVGVCRRKLAEAEGRVVSCSVCGKDIVLEPGDDTTAVWFHTACKASADG